MFTPKSIKHLILCHNICLICMENACDNINMDDSKFNDSPDKSNQNSITNGVHKVLSVYVMRHLDIITSQFILIVLREIYPVYVQSLPDNNDNVPILTYYDRSSIMRQRLANEGNHNNSIDTERYVHDGTLVTVLQPQ